LIERVALFAPSDATPWLGVARLLLPCDPPSPVPSPASAPLPNDPFAGDPAGPGGWLTLPEWVVEVMAAGVVAGVSGPWNRPRKMIMPARVSERTSTPAASQAKRVFLLDLTMSPLVPNVARLTSRS
jgi:hypothetical protein